MIGAGVVVGALLAVAWWRGGSAVVPQAAAAPPGAAVVMNVGACPKVELPDLAQVSAGPEATVRALRRTGLFVAADPTERCLAISSPARFDRVAVQTGRLPAAALAAAILDDATSEQLPARQKGYLPAEALSDTQRAAADQLTRPHRMQYSGGSVPGAVQVGIWQTWDVYVCAHLPEAVICRRMYGSSRPPTPDAVATPPLAGSPLWWAWADAEADWGEGRVTITARTCALRDLLSEIGRAAGLTIAAPDGEASKRVAVAAQDVPARRLVWAIGCAFGLASHLETTEPKRLVLQAAAPRGAEPNGLTPLAGGAYYTSRASAVAPELLPRLEELPADQYWVGWRYSDLPLLYRRAIDDEWQRTHALYGHRGAPALDPNHTFVLWVKAIAVSVGLLEPGGRGTASDFTLPAL
jgi:hypothetical protein